MIISTGLRDGFENFRVFYNNELSSPTTGVAHDFVSTVNTLAQAGTTSVFVAELYLPDNSLFGTLVAYKDAGTIILDNTSTLLYWLDEADTSELFNLSRIYGLTQYYSGDKLLNSAQSYETNLQVYNDIQLGSDYWFIYVYNFPATFRASAEIKGTLLSVNNFASYNVSLSNVSAEFLSFTSARDQRTVIHVEIGEGRFIDIEYTSAGQVFSVPNTEQARNSLYYYAQQGSIFLR